MTKRSFQAGALACAFALSNFAFAQNESSSSALDDIRPDEKIDAIDSVEASASESSGSGSQRPVSVKGSSHELTFAFDTELYYTSNVFLTEDTDLAADVLRTSFLVDYDFGSHRVGDFIYNPSLGLAYQRNYHGVVEDQSVENVDIGVFDFDQAILYWSNVFKSASGWNFDTGVEYTGQYEFRNSYQTLYEGYALYINARKVFVLDGNNFIIARFDARNHWTDSSAGEDLNDRIEGSATIAYFYIRGAFTISAYYRALYSDYDQGANEGRSDLLHTFGVKGIYKLNKTVRLKVFIKQDTKSVSGSDTAQEYDKLDAGAGVTLRF